MEGKTSENFNKEILSEEKKEEFRKFKEEGKLWSAAAIAEDSKMYKEALGCYIRLSPSTIGGIEDSLRMAEKLGIKEKIKKYTLKKAEREIEYFDEPPLYDIALSYANNIIECKEELELSEEEIKIWEEKIKELSEKVEEHDEYMAEIENELEESNKGNW